MGLELTYDVEYATEAFEGDLVPWGHGSGTANPETTEYGVTGTAMESLGDFDGLAGE